MVVLLIPTTLLAALLLFCLSAGNQGGHSSVPANEKIYVVTPSIQITTYLAGFANHNGTSTPVTFRLSNNNYNVVYESVGNSVRGGKYVIFGLA